MPTGTISRAVHTVAFGGALTIGHAEDLRTALAEALQEHERVVIDCADASKIDLTFVQIVLAARRSAVAAGKRIGLARPADGPLADVLVRAGLAAPAGQPPIAGQQFWFDKETDDGEDRAHRG